MSWKASKLAGKAIIAASLLAVSGAAWAEAIVVRSTGQVANDYPPRTRLADNAVVRLTGTGTLTVLTRAGTRTYSRPGAYRLDGARRAAGSIFAAANTSGGTARTGVVRCDPATVDCDSLTGAASDAPRRGAWQVDTRASGTVCYLPTQPVSLWRSEATGGAEITVTRLSDDASATIAFAGGQNSQTWPAAIALAPGAEYRIDAPGLAQPTLLRFVALESDPEQHVEVMDGLLAQGCEAQIDLFADQMDQADGDGAG